MNQYSWRKQLSELRRFKVHIANTNSYLII